MKKIIKARIKDLQIQINTFDCQQGENLTRRAKINLLESILEEKKKHKKKEPLNFCNRKARITEFIQETFPGFNGFTNTMTFVFDSRNLIEPELQKELQEAKDLKEIIQAIKKFEL